MRSKHFLLRTYFLVLLTALFIICQNTFFVNAVETELYLGGYAAGFTINTRGAEVIDIVDVVTEKGIESPAKVADIKKNDIILNMAGKQTNTFEDIDEILKSNESKTLIITINRQGDIQLKEITPVRDLSGNYKLGILLRDKLAGIGTITYATENGDFMALGHPICIEDQKIVEITGGNLYACSVLGVQKGERGKPGELKGLFVNDAQIGEIYQNLNVGIKGKFTNQFNLNDCEKIKPANATCGNASIVATIDGMTPQRFDISIVKADYSAKDNRNFVIKVTDETLLEKTGGIVQGMSGSPIIQDGKIVGAITHVFLNDPTRGFGISIYKMMQ